MFFLLEILYQSRTKLLFYFNLRVIILLLSFSDNFFLLAGRQWWNRYCAGNVQAELACEGTSNCRFRYFSNIQRRGLGKEFLLICK